MAYVTIPRFDTKQDFVRAVESGRSFVIQSDEVFVDVPANGRIQVNGFQVNGAGRIITWSANITLVDGLIQEVE